MNIVNSRNEELFLVIITNSKEFNEPMVFLKSWQSAKNIFEETISEINNDSNLVKQITVLRDEENKILKAQLLCNNKGWGYDYFKCIKVEKAYAF